jgi:hypothetical protein
MNGKVSGEPTEASVKFAKRALELLEKIRRPARRWCTDWMFGVGVGWDRRPVSVLIPDARRAIQGQRQISPPYPEAEAPADELAGV